MSNRLTDWTVLLNPAAGSGKGARRWPKIEAALKSAGIQYDLLRSEGAGHLLKLSREAIENGARRLICIGGDGSLHEVVNGVLSQQVCDALEVEIGMIPLGTGNDWIRTYRFPSRMEAQIKVILKGNHIVQDIGSIKWKNGERFFVNFAGFGFDAFVVQQLDKTKVTGQVSYLLGLFKYMFQYRNQEVHLKLDESELEIRMFMAVCCIGRYAGGGMLLAPEADPADGQLDFTIVGDFSKLEVVKTVPSLYNGQFAEMEKIESRRLKVCEGQSVEADPQLGVQADGEFLGDAPFRISMEGRKCRFIVPG